MPRTLTIQRTLVTPPDREKFALRLKRNRAYYTAAGCRYDDPEYARVSALPEGATRDVASPRKPTRG